MSLKDIISGFSGNTTACNAAAGLFVDGSERSVPLRLRSVRAQVHCDAGFSDTKESFAFVADEDVSVEFKFPLPPGAAVYKAEAQFGDKHIVAQVKERKDAETEFRQAVEQGHTAVMATKEDSTQIFTLKLGNLEAMTEAIIDIHYLRVLDSVGTALEYCHTSTWTPPYTGSAGDRQRGPEAVAQQDPRFATEVHYTLDYEITLLSNREIKAVESAEPITVQDLGNRVGKKVALSETVADPSKDLSVVIELAPLTSNTNMVSTAAGAGTVSIQECELPIAAPNNNSSTPKTKKTTALATFIPSAVVKEADAKAALNTEIIFIVDCSGSMSGERIDQAREAALYFIKDLPSNRGIKFNVVAFGSNHIMWSKSCKDLNETTMADAVQWVQDKIHADLGGTEILETFKAVYKQPITPGYSRQIVFLTDGGITGSEESAVFDLVKGVASDEGSVAKQSALGARIMALKNKVLGRSQNKDKQEDGAEQADSQAPPPPPAMPAVHCLGIGHGVHRGLLDGIASRTGSVVQYVVDGENISRKVGLLKKSALSGNNAIYNPRIVCGSAIVQQVPYVLPPRLFPDEPLMVLLEFTQWEQEHASIQLKGRRADGSDVEMIIPLKDVKIQQAASYAILHAMGTVSQLVDGSSPLHVDSQGLAVSCDPSSEDVKAAVVKAALPANLITPHTAAVGVMLQKNPLDPTQVKTVEVPLAVPHGAELFKKASACGDAYPFSGSAIPFSASFQAYAAPLGSLLARAAIYPPPPPAPCAAPPHPGLALRCAAAAPPPAPTCAAPGSGPMAQAFRKTAAPQKRGMFGGMFGGGGGGGAQPEMKNKGSARSSSPSVEACAFMAAAPEKIEELDLCGAACDAMECADEDEAKEYDTFMDTPMLPEASVQPGNAGNTNVKLPSTSASDVMSMLNLKRNVEGYWLASDHDLTSAIVSQISSSDPGAFTAVMAAKPAELSADQWVTVLALAFLRKYCASMKSTWEGMEVKAMTWLVSSWPQGARPVGITIITATKML